jgi:hypothetical protein
MVHCTIHNTDFFLPTETIETDNGFPVIKRTATRSKTAMSETDRRSAVSCRESRHPFGTAGPAPGQGFASDDLIKIGGECTVVLFDDRHRIGRSTSKYLFEKLISIPDQSENMPSAIGRSRKIAISTHK